MTLRTASAVRVERYPTFRIRTSFGSLIGTRVFRELPGGMRMRTNEPRRFEAIVEDEGAGVFVVTWREHIDGASLVRHLESLEDLVASRESCFLLVDATHVSGYDLDTRIVARNWSRSGRTSALRAIAIVAGSRLAAAESPASVLAPASTARLFDSIHPARRWLQHLALAASGEYPRIAIPPAKSETG